MTCGDCFHRFDAAVTREYVGQLREAQGEFASAREVRRRGVRKGEMACGSNKVLLRKGCFCLSRSQPMQGQILSIDLLLVQACMPVMLVPPAVLRADVYNSAAEVLQWLPLRILLLQRLPGMHAAWYKSGVMVLFAVTDHIPCNYLA